MERSCLRRLAIFSSLIIYVLVISLVLAALLTEYWVETSALRKDGEESPMSFMHSGLFHGVRQLDWGPRPQKKYFAVLDEIHNGVSFISKTTWIFMLFFVALGLLWTFIGLLISLINTVTEEIPTIVGPTGVYLWSSLAFFSYTIAATLISKQFNSTIANNVLLPEQLDAGFSSTGLARFGISFWLFSAATLLLLVPCILIFLTAKPEIKREKVAEFDDTTLMY